MHTKCNVLFEPLDILTIFIFQAGLTKFVLQVRKCRPGLCSDGWRRKTKGRADTAYTECLICIDVFTSTFFEFIGVISTKAVRFTYREAYCHSVLQPTLHRNKEFEFLSHARHLPVRH